MFKRNKKQIPKIILVTGIGRSGTTMLRKALGSHSHIYYNGSENNIFIDLLTMFHRNCTLPSRKIAMQLTQSQYNTEVKKVLINFLYPNNKKAKRNFKYILISSALNIESLPYIKEVFPEISVIQIVRNGIEVVSSRMNYEGFKNNTFSNHIEKWNLGIEVNFKCKEVFDEQYKLVRHENFLDANNLKIQLTNIFNWLRLDYDENVFNLINKTRFHPTTIIDEDSDNLNNRSNRWKKWNSEQKSEFKNKASKNMSILGYSTPY